MARDLAMAASVSRRRSCDGPKFFSKIVAKADHALEFTQFADKPPAGRHQRDRSLDSLQCPLVATGGANLFPELFSSL